ncbi:MAG: hypothetical protein ABJB05_07010 [Parafilimonas sp.]
MKKNLTLFIAVIFTVFNVHVANAKIWRVNNKSNFNGTSLYGDNFGGTSAYPVFNEINNAVGWASVNNSDTLYVEGCVTAYIAATITKKLTIIGPGYFLNENPKTSNDLLTAQIGSISFNTGSAGSQLIGVSIVHIYPYSLHLNANNITVKRCWIADPLHIGSGISDIYILENFFSNSQTSTALVLDYPYDLTTDLVFNNNVSQKTLIWSGSIQQCNNNVFDGPASMLNLQFTTPEFTNNILKSTNASVDINGGSKEKISYNIGTLSTQFGTTNNNKIVANMSSLFVPSGTSDGMYKLKANSAGSSNGSDGTDRGAFGGSVVANRYTLSGLAAIPVIYKLTTSGVATQSSGLSVTISAKTIK